MSENNGKEGEKVSNLVIISDMTLGMFLICGGLAPRYMT